MTQGIPGAAVATVAVFMPSFLLVLGVLPFWNTLRNSARIQGALISVNAAVVGILLAALYHPLWTTAIGSSRDFALVSILFGMLMFWKLPPWVIVIAGALGGAVFN
jgi:chromate transporter